MTEAPLFPASRGPRPGAAGVLRWLRRAALLLLAALFLLLAGLVWLVATPGGARFALERGAALVGGRLQLAAVEGSLLGPLHLQEVAYADSATHCAVASLELEWRPMALLRRQLAVTRLIIGGVDLRTVPAPDTAAAPPADLRSSVEALRRFSLPIAVSLEECRLRRLSLATPEPLPALDSLSLSLQAGGQQLFLEQLKLGAPQGTLDLSAALTGWGADSLGVDLQWTLDAATAHARGQWQVDGCLDSLRATGDLALALAAVADTAHLAARVEINPFLPADPALASPRAALHLQWRHLAWPGLPVASPAGSLSVAGDTTAFALSAAFETARPPSSGAAPLPSLAWSLAADGNRTGLDLHHLETDPNTPHAPLRVLLRGRIPFRPDGAIDCAWSLEVDSLAALLPESPAPPEGARADRALEVRGELRGDGAITGTLPQPALWFQFAGDSLGLASASCRAWRVAGDLSPARSFWIDLRAAELRASTATLGALHLHAAGTAADHTLQLDLAGASGALSAELLGRIDAVDTLWSGDLVRCDADWGGARARLARDAHLRFSPGTFSLEDFRWRSGAAEMNLAAGWRAQPIAATAAAARPPLLDLTLSGVDLAPLNGLLAASPLLLQGRLSACAQAIAAPQLQASMEAALAAGRLRLAASNQQFPVRRCYARGEASATAFHALLDLAVPGFADVEAAASGLAPPAGTWSEADLRGDLRCGIPDLSFIEPLLPDLEELSGAAALDLHATGTLSAPRLRGRAEVVEAGFDVPLLGAEYRHLNARIATARNDSLVLSGEIHSAGSRLDLTGAARLRPAPAGSLEVHGEEFLVASAPGLWLKISPHAYATWRDRQVHVGGSLGLPEGRLVLAAPPSPAVPIDPDVVVIGREPAAPPPPPFDLGLDLRLDLGPDLAVEGFGLAAHPQGHLRLQSAGLAVPPTATGELRLVDGTYRAFGQDLEIERGRVVFAAGPLEDPGLDFRARRRAEDGVIAGFEVGGSALQPTVTLYSEPAMDDADALSYILLGHGRSAESSNAEEDRLGAALAMLGVQGGGLLVRSVADRLGVEEARIATDGEIEESELILGTHITPRLWASYGLGLFNAASALRARYRLNRHWALEGETGAANSADLLYTIER